MTFNSQRALELLRRGTGVCEAVFREDQEAAIRHVVEGRGRLLIVQKTGWGVRAKTINSENKEEWAAN